MQKHNYSKCLCLLLSVLFCSLDINAQQRDEESALEVARNFYLNSRQHKAKGLQSDGNSLKLVRSSKEKAYYIYSGDEGEGFVIVSGDERMVPVLGYSFTAQIADDVPENVQNWLDIYENEYEELQNGTVTQMPMLKASAQSDAAVSPMLTSQWGQSSPYYNDCPVYGGSHCVTGCVCTSISQIMYFYKYPECGTGSISYNTTTYGITVSDNLANHPFDWANMSDTYSSSSSAAQKSAVANLCYAAGIAISTDYCPSGSSAQLINTMNALADNFGYDKDMTMHKLDYMTTEDWHELIQGELHEGRPVLYSAVTSDNEGHSFVLDGYTPPSSSTGTPYYHVNWGWDGRYDGDFALTALKAFIYSYTESHEIITGIQPEDYKQTINSCCMGTGSVSTANMKSTSLSPVTVSLKVYNYAYRPFTGKVIIKVITPDGSVKTVDSTSFYNTSTTYGNYVTGTYTPDGTIGNYTFVAYSMANGSSTEEKVSIAGDLTFTVLSGESELPQKETDIQATAMTINSCSAADVSVSLSDIINMGTDEFIGDIKLAIADTEGNLISTLGEGTNITSLSHYSSLTFPRTLRATITGVSDGQYRLYAASCQAGFSGWTYLRKWSRSGNTITAYNKPLYTDIWMKNGTVYLSDPGKQGSQVKLSITVNGGGSVTDDQGNAVANGTSTFNFEYGSSTTLHFSPDNGMQLTSVNIDGAEVITGIGDLTYTLPEMASDVTVNVNYDSAIDFWKTVQFTYDTSASTVSLTTGGDYASGSKLICKTNNNSGVTILETSLYIIDEGDGSSEGNMLTTARTLDNGYIRTWTLTLGHSYSRPVIHETIRVRGEDYTMSCGPDYADGILTVAKKSTGEVVGVYSLDGRKVSPDSKGIKIFRYSDGRSEKRY